MKKCPEREFDVVIVRTPSAGAGPRPQTLAPAAGEPCAGSPASVAAPTVVLLDSGLKPVNSMASANISFAGRVGPTVMRTGADSKVVPFWMAFAVRR